MVGTVTLPDSRESRHWPSETDWCPLKVRCRMQVDECLPPAVMIDEERSLQRSRFGEVGILRRGVNKMPVGVAGTLASEPENVICPLDASRQKDDSKVRSWAALSLALVPSDKRVLVGFVTQQLRANTLLSTRINRLGGLVDFKIGVELLAALRELTEAIRVKFLRSDFDDRIAVAIEKRNVDAVAVSGEQRMHDDLGEHLRVLESRRGNRLEVRAMWERCVGSVDRAKTFGGELVPVGWPTESVLIVLETRIDSWNAFMNTLSKSLAAGSLSSSMAS